MNIVYIAPNIDHLHVSFVEELISFVGMKNVSYYVQDRIIEERAKLGFQLYNFSWIYDIGTNNESFDDALNNADVIICSVRDFYSQMEGCLKKGKIVFYFSERWFKDGLGKYRLLYPKLLHVYLKFRKLSMYPNFYYLAQGYYAYEDFKYLRLCNSRIFNWGYWTDINEHKDICGLSLPVDKINILWCGRMLKWKKVDVLIKAYIELTRHYDNIHLCVLGRGNEERYLRNLLQTSLPASSYTIKSSLPMTQVRSLMNQADIYVLPSNGNEGWGAVVNEAMAEKCVVIGGNRCGAVKTMIHDGVNGFSFDSSNVGQLIDILRTVIDDRKLMKRIAARGQSDIIHFWSPAVAAERFLNIVKAIIEGKDIRIYRNGILKVYDE